MVMDGGLLINLDTEEGGKLSKKKNLKNQIELMSTLLDDLGYEYERMTSSGQETLDQLWEICGLPKWDDSFESYEKTIKRNKGWYTGKIEKGD